MENDKISLTILFQHLLSAEILSKRKIEFILPYLVRNFQINARDKLTARCILTFSHYIYNIHSLFKQGLPWNYKTVAIV